MKHQLLTALLCILLNKGWAIEKQIVQQSDSVMSTTFQIPYLIEPIMYFVGHDDPLDLIPLMHVNKAIKKIVQPYYCAKRIYILAQDNQRKMLDIYCHLSTTLARLSENDDDEINKQKATHLRNLLNGFVPVLKSQNEKFAERYDFFEYLKENPEKFDYCIFATKNPFLKLRISEQKEEDARKPENVEKNRLFLEQSRNEMAKVSALETTSGISFQGELARTAQWFFHGYTSSEGFFSQHMLEDREIISDFEKSCEDLKIGSKFLKTLEKYKLINKKLVNNNRKNEEIWDAHLLNSDNREEENPPFQEAENFYNIFIQNYKKCEFPIIFEEDEKESMIIQKLFFFIKQKKQEFEEIFDKAKDKMLIIKKMSQTLLDYYDQLQILEQEEFLLKKDIDEIKEKVKLLWEILYKLTDKIKNNFLTFQADTSSAEIENITKDFYNIQQSDQLNPEVFPPIDVLKKTLEENSTKRRRFDKNS